MARPIGQTILLPRGLHRWAKRRAKGVGQSVNRYMRTLIEMDKKVLEVRDSARKARAEHDETGGEE